MDPLKVVRENILRMAGYVPGEQPRGGKVIKLNTNENPYPPSPRVLEAIRSSLDESLRLYPQPTADDLREKAAEVYGLPPECIIAGNGSDELLTMLVRVFVGEGEKVVYPTPTYTLYETLAEIQGGGTVEVPFPSDFSLPAGLAESEGKVLFLANPNSPSGTLVPTDQVRRLAESFRGIVVVDEAYADFAGETSIPLVRDLENVVVLRTFSKSFSLAGIRLGLAFGNPGVIEQMMKVKDSYNVNRLTQVAGIAALEDLEWMKENVRKVVRTRERMTEKLKEMGFTVLPSRANFVFARREGEYLKNLYEGLKERGILVRFFDTPSLRDALRITVGTDEEVDLFLEELASLLK
ncbi:MAG: histidinol-phosphate transaminase [Deltaproteobacteria bacterium]|nr:MAG: histidinol-phosphate transaminase [Deltaproteobacteria bacterium]